MPGPNTITPKQLLRLIGTPDCPQIIDVCTDEDFAYDPVLIPTGKRMPHTDPMAIVDLCRGKQVIVVCQKGKKLSQEITSFLQSEGISAEALEGGIHGWRALPDAPAIPHAKFHQRNPAQPFGSPAHGPRSTACPALG